LGDIQPVKIPILPVIVARDRSEEVYAMHQELQMLLHTAVHTPGGSAVLPE